MSVMKLSSGGLFVQSPAELTPELKAQLDQLGEVRFVAATSKLHGHMYMEQYRAAYPNAELLAAPGLAARRTDLRFDHLLGDAPDPRWGTDIDQVAVAGHRWLTEIAFFHRPSRTVILGDMGYHIGDSSPLKTRLMLARFKFTSGLARHSRSGRQSSTRRRSGGRSRISSPGTSTASSPATARSSTATGRQPSLTGTTGSFRPRETVRRHLEMLEVQSVWRSLPCSYSDHHRER